MALVLVSMYATQQTRLNALQKWYSVVMSCHSSYARTLMAREQHPCATHDVKMQYRDLRSNASARHIWQIQKAGRSRRAVHEAPEPKKENFQCMPFLLFLALD